MPASSPIPRQTTGKTFIIACALLGVAVLVQIGAITWAFLQHDRTPKPAPTARENVDPANGRTLPFEALALSDPLLENAAPVLPAATPAPIIPPPKPVPVPAIKFVEKLLPESRYQELIDQGKTLRDRGDMSGALTKLREAQTLNPNSPQAMAEIAVTYEKMGLPDRAAEHWKRIHQMGETTGSYFIAADARLKQSQAMAYLAAQNQTKSNPAEDFGARNNSSAILAVGEISSEPENDPAAVNKFTLRVPLKIRAGARVDVRDVAIHVLFYDMIDGKSIVQTNANVNSRWANPPPDWADSDTEILEVQYSQPRPDPRESKPEERKYFGYIVRLYYKSELQDTRAEPLRLAAQFSAPQILETAPSK